MRDFKVDETKIREALREWTTARQLGEKLGVSKPTAQKYLGRLRKYLDRKSVRDRWPGPLAHAYRVK